MGKVVYYVIKDDDGNYLEHIDGEPHSSLTGDIYHPTTWGKWWTKAIRYGSRVAANMRASELPIYCKIIETQIIEIDISAEKISEEYTSQDSRQITGKLRGISLKRWEDLKWILREDHNISNGSEKPASDAKVMDYLINNFFDTL